MLLVCVLILITVGVCIFQERNQGQSSLWHQAVSRCHGISIHKTQIIKCNISHRRLFPRSHGFIYPYLTVGIPVRSPTSNWLLSVDSKQWWRRGWLHVSPKDHLNRGNSGNTLSANLDAYLKQQKLDPAAFPHVYLLTSPSFLHYSFSPASFWYLYDGDIKLKYIIAEVNNTFDERRMYLFPAPEGPGAFKQTHRKDFHVSPFSSRKGSYILTTANPANGEDVSLTVTLRSSKNHPKLVACWWSDAPAIDSSNYSILLSIWLLTCWGWTVLSTFPKIILQATYLAQLCGLSIWYRPEPKESAVPRRATSAEVLLASIFAQYIRYLVGSAPKDVNISVTCPTAISQQSDTYNQGINGVLFSSDGVESAPLELRIHTPQFYRQMITHAKLTDLLSYTLLDPYEENCTVWSNDGRGLISTLHELETVEAIQKRRFSRQHSPGFGLEMAWAVYARLRCVTRPVKGAYPDCGFPKLRAAGSQKSPYTTDLQLPGCKEYFLDEFVRFHCGPLLQMRFMLVSLGLMWRTRIMNVIGGE